jgi:thioredoxin reductase
VNDCGNSGTRLEGVTVAHTVTGDTRELQVAAMFVFIGTAPRTALPGPDGRLLLQLATGRVQQPLRVYDYWRGAS